MSASKAVSHSSSVNRTSKRAPDETLRPHQKGQLDLAWPQQTQDPFV